MDTLTPYTPFTPISKLRRELDDLFHEVLPGWNDNRLASFDTTVWAPRADLTEKETEYVFSMDVPGVNKKDITVNFENNVLTVSGERKSEAITDKDDVHRVERAYGRFFRAFTVPKAVKAEAIQATFKDGVLTVRVPKAQESKPQRITVA